jgi:hypothetical protein
MNRTKRLGRVGGLAAAAIAATPFACLWVFQVTNAEEPPTAEVRLDIAIWMAVFAMPAMLAAWLLWRAWWRQAGARVSALDGPGLLLAAATATLPAGRRDWGAAMAAELTQVQERAARWRFAAGCASAAVFPPGSNRAAVVVTGALAVGATTAAALVTGAALPAGRVFGLTFVGLVGGLATLMVARPRRVGEAGPGPAVAGLALAGVAGCAAFTTYYLAEYPSYPRTRPPMVALSLPPVTAVVLAVVLAGCLWLALRPPRWLAPDRLARRFGVAMAVVLVGGFLLESRLIQPGLRPGSQGMMGYLFNGPLLVILPGSVAAAVVGRSFRTGLGACVLALVLGAPLLVMAWLAEALPWYQQGRGLLLDGEGGLGVGANLGNAVWWSLIFLVLWALPMGVLGAAAGTRLRRARKHAGPAPTS